jgi:tRNA pseudouridine38-40 synthase
MLACRTNTPKSLIAETYGKLLPLYPGASWRLGPKRIHIPKAPPLGLLLESPQFRTYNNRIESNIYGGPDDRDKVEFTPYADQMQEFKVKHIYEKLREDELKTHVYVPSLYCL